MEYMDIRRGQKYEWLTPHKWDEDENKKEAIA